MKLTGPVAYYKYRFRGRTVRLLADLHNDTTGGCPGNPLDYDDNHNPIGTDSKSMTLLRYVDHMLKKGSNFYLESPFVLVDSVPGKKSSLSDLDYIDKLTAFFADELQRDKTKSRYVSHVHYTDIRDVYETKYINNRRKATSANPFSGKWLAVQLKSKEDFVQGFSLIESILDHSHEILDEFIGEYTGLTYNLPIMGKSWLERLYNMRKVTSVYKGIRTHRVAKQLLKLDTEDRENVIKWCKKRFDDELLISRQRYNQWVKTVKNTKNPEKHPKLVEAPIMILIPLSSVIMDTYTIARLIYQKSESDIIFAGLAHINNYREFFDEHGELVTEIMPNERNMRCIVGIN